MELPLFPLHTVLFPGRPLPLHIFERRYRALLEDCLDGDGRFGVVAIRSGREVGDDAEIFSVGTIAEIESVSKLEGGRANITTRGVQRFRINEVLRGISYLRAEAEPIAEPPPPPSAQQRALQLRDLLCSYLSALGAPGQALERLPSDPERLAWLAASTLQVELPELQRILEVDNCDQRLGETLRVLRREANLVRHLGSVGSLQPPGPGGADLN